MTGTDEHPLDETSVLASLPATRPQRRSPKRAAPKPDVTGPAGTAQTPQETHATRDAHAPTRPPRPPRARRSAAASEPAAKQTQRAADDPPVQPAQGFEANPLHGSLNPPTGVELLSAVAQGVAELVEFGLALTRRLAHSVLDRLPGL